MCVCVRVRGHACMCYSVGDLLGELESQTLWPYQVLPFPSVLSARRLVKELEMCQADEMGL